MHQSQKVFFLPLEITPVKSSSSHVDCAPEYLKCNGNFILSLIGSKAYHVTCSHESQPTTNKNYGEGIVESINGRFERIVQSFDVLCSVLVAGEKLEKQ